MVYALSWPRILSLTTDRTHQRTESLILGVNIHLQFRMACSDVATSRTVLAVSRIAPRLLSEQSSHNERPAKSSTRLRPSRIIRSQVVFHMSHLSSALLAATHPRIVMDSTDRCRPVTMEGEIDLSKPMSPMHLEVKSNPRARAASRS